LERQSFLEPTPKNRLAAPVDAGLRPAPRPVEGRRLRVFASGQERLSMPGLPEALDCFIEQRRAVATPLSPVDHAQRPYVTRLVICAGEALNPDVILRNKKNRLIQILLDLRGRDEPRIFKPIFSRSVPHLGNPRQVWLRRLAYARGYRDQLCPSRQA
jgi:hypothetical protein